MTFVTAAIHDTETCNATLGQPCDMCRWASRQERESAKQRLDAARRMLIDEIDRMQAEVNQLDGEYDALDGQGGLGMEGQSCPQCSRSSDLLATTNEWQFYCATCDIRFNKAGTIVTRADSWRPKRVEVDRLDGEYNALDDDRESRNQQDYEADLEGRQ